MPDPTSASSPTLRQVVAADGTRRVELAGRWNLQALERRVAKLKLELAAYGPDERCHWDLSGVEVLDHAGAMLLWHTWGRRRAPNLQLKPEHEGVFRNLTIEQEPAPPPARFDLAGPVVFVGGKVLLTANHLFDITVLLGRVTLDCIYLAGHPTRIPWREISANVYRTGTQALGITALVGFLVGVVLSYLSSHQLKLFGADIFIINILGISVIRELGPVLAAILVAGRSGSSMTAQIGVMRVTEELDAMTVMGIPQTLRLILPRMIALAISLPLIVLWTDAIALIGGMVSANAELGIGYRFFLSSLPDAVPVANLWLGLGKGVVFGLLVALIACHFGLRIEPNTESLGIGTTNSVVTAITIVILVDAVFAVLFRDVGMP